jgi:cytochrome c-type biogenesis protein CcmF
MGSIGYFALLVAFITALYSCLAFITGARYNSSGLLASAKNGLIAVASLVSLSIILLVYAIFSHDFSLAYVADYTSRTTAPIYLLSAIWAGNSGAILLWLWILSLLAVFVYLRKSSSQGTLIPYVGLVLVFTEGFLLLLLLVFANPFTAAGSTPADGLGPMLATQTIGMVLHPPSLIIGYAGFTIPFAFAVSALITGKTDDDWLVTSRRWLLLAWIFLGIGNIIGAWWAYMELGWGGYWAWDPVENASLMPWLMATAFLHSSILQRRNGQFKVWSMVLVVLTFALVIFGAFLTRSSIPGSQHTFPDTAQMGPYFLTFIGLVLVGSLGLVYYRRRELQSDANREVLNREATFLLNNILLVAAVIFTFVLTIFPWISSAAGNTAVVKASSFNKLDGTIFLLVILLIGVCSVIGWKRDTLGRLLRKILLPFVVALVAGVLIALVARQQPVATLAFFILAFVVSSIVLDFIKAALSRARARGENPFAAGWHLPWANSQRYGGYLVHVSILLIALGIIGSSFFPIENQSTLKVGDSVKVNQYTITYTGANFSSTPDTETVKADLTLYNSGSVVAKMTPMITYQASRDQAGPEVAVRSNAVEDVYIRLDGISDSSNTADFTILINPLVIWIWIGGGVFLLGGLVTFWPSRRSRRRVATSDESSSATGEDN